MKYDSETLWITMKYHVKTFQENEDQLEGGIVLKLLKIPSFFTLLHIRM